MTINYVDNPYDFIGFKYGNNHSLDFNILHVSNSNRYSSDMFPQFQATTTTVPGANQTYFFGDNFTQRSFSLNIAYDNVSEEDFMKMVQWLKPNKPQPLIFDETPYKYYIAIISQPPQFQYICFADKQNNNKRVYKGEATIQFVCYYPFAKSRVNSLEEFKALPFIENEKVPALSDDQMYGWYSEGLLLNDTPTYTFENTDSITLINCSEMESDYKMYISGFWNGTITIKGEDSETTFVVNGLSKKGTDAGVIYDSARQLCIGASTEGVDDPSSNLYNRYVNKMLPKLPQGKVTITFTPATGGSAPTKVLLDYNFLYY